MLKINPAVWLSCKLVVSHLFVLAFTSPIYAQSVYHQPVAAAVPIHQYRTRVEDNHRVVIDSDGVSPEADQISRQLNDMFAHIAHQHCHRIVLFIHGGLVSLEEANKTAANLEPKITLDDPTAYPIFLNWEAGLTSSYMRHLIYERNGISYKGTPSAWAAIAITPFVFVADLGRGIANHAMNTMLNFGKVLENNDALYDERPRSFVTKNKFLETLRSFTANPGASQAGITAGYAIMLFPTGRQSIFIWDLTSLRLM
jgi:hypothetical protein